MPDPVDLERLDALCARADVGAWETLMPVSSINAITALWDAYPFLSAELRRLREERNSLRQVLERIAKPTYGTELCNTDEENLAILYHTLDFIRLTARNALSARGGPR